MLCEVCGSTMRIARTKTYGEIAKENKAKVKKGDMTIDDVPIDVYTDHDYVCVNKECSEFGGDPETKEIVLDKPVKVAKAVKNKVN